MFFCFIFDADLVVGHREGYPVSFFNVPSHTGSEKDFGNHYIRIPR